MAFNFIKRFTGGTSGEGDQAEMSFVDHLEALRWHLARMITAVMIFAVLIFIYIDAISDKIIMGPLQNGFVTYDWFCKLSHKLHLGNKLCLQTPHVELQSTTLAGQFNSAMSISFVGGLIIAFPYILWELWRFISPALTAKEKKGTTGAVGFVTFFFLLGIAFGYFIMAPFTFSFLANFTLGTHNLVTIKPTFADYVDTLVNLTIGSGLAFQLPVLSYVLTRIGIIGPAFLKTYRKYAYVVLFIIAAIITPSPDWMSQMIVVIPLIALFEFSIFVSARAKKESAEKEAKEWS